MTEQVSITVPPTIQPAVDNVRWNFTVNVLDITFFTLALSLVSRETVMPVLVSSLTDSKLAIGMIPAIFTLGYYLPQLFSANQSERLVHKKPFVAVISFFGERLPYLLIGISLYFFALDSPLIALSLLFIFLGVHSSSAGYVTPAWFDMIAKVIPLRRRGIWSGLGHGLGAVISIVVLYLVALPVMDTAVYPRNFVILFLLAFAAMLVSWVNLVLNREPPSANVKQTVTATAYFRQLPGILRRDSNYARFLISRSIVQLATMASAFYIVFGTEAFSVDASGVVVLTIVTVSSVAVMNLVWGFIGDHSGHKLVLTLAAFCLALAAVIAIAAPDQHYLAATFVLLGAYTAADNVSGLNIILEFCAPEDRPTYIGLTNTLLAPVITLAPLIGAWLATALGYQPMFAVSMAVSAAGGTLLLFWVREPRQPILESAQDVSVRLDAS
jgi:MFS family permease